MLSYRQVGLKSCQINVQHMRGGGFCFGLGKAAW